MCPNFFLRLYLRTRGELMLANFGLKIRPFWDSGHENWYSYTFLENERLFARTTYTKLLIYLKAIYGQKMKEIDFQLLPLDGRYFLTVALKRPFSGNKKLYTSKEVKEFSKMLQRSNSVRHKDHRKSMLECTGNTSASWPLNRQRSFAQSKTRILYSILHPYF